MAKKPGIVESAEQPEAAEPMEQQEKVSPEGVEQEEPGEQAEPGAEQEDSAAGTEPSSEKGVIAGAVDEAEAGRTPQEQKLYDQIMLAAYKIMYSKSGFPILLKKLADGKQDIGHNVGHTLGMIMLSIQGVARKQGDEFPPDLMFEAGLGVLEDLMQVGQKTGMIREGFEEKVMTRALFVAFKVYGDSEIRNGNITQQDMKNATNEIASLGIDPEAAMEATGAKQELSINEHTKQMLEDHPPGTSAKQVVSERLQRRQPQPQPAPAGGIVNQAAGV